MGDTSLDGTKGKLPNLWPRFGLRVSPSFFDLLRGCSPKTSSMDKYHKIFNGRKKLTPAVLREGMITGGAVTLAERLRTKHGWDGINTLAAPIVVCEGGAIVDTHWALLGGLRDISFAANYLWTGGEKEVRVSVRAEDLSMFTFAVGNLSNWLNREELDVVYTTAEGDISFEDAQERGGGEFCLRALICPTSHTGVSVWIGAHPAKRETLEGRLGAHHNSNLTPHITLQLSQVEPLAGASGRHAHVLLTRQEQEGEGFGMGVIPWLDVTAEGEDDAVMPDSEDVKEATLRFMRGSATSATTTTGAAIEKRTRALEAGTLTAPRNLAHCFPEYQPAAALPGAQQGQSDFFPKLLVRLNWA